PWATARCPADPEARPDAEAAHRPVAAAGAGTGGRLMDSFHFDEKYLSQIPALQVLVNLGYQYLTPAEALAARGGKAGNVLLEEILRAQLKKLNRIQHKGGSYLFSEENLQSAIQRLKNVKYD